MALNLYETIATRNGSLAKFFDENVEMARLVKKMVGLLVNIAEDWRVDAAKLTFDIIASPDGKMMVIKVKRP